MPFTPGLRRALEAAAADDTAALKRRAQEQLGALIAAVTPPLTPHELAVGLELEPPGVPKVSLVTRWLSEAPRQAKAIPDEATRALLARVFAGGARMAVCRTAGPDALRQVLFCEPWEVTRLGPDWEVSAIGAPIPPASPVPAVQNELVFAVDWSGGAPASTPTGAASTAPTTAIRSALGAPPRRLGPWLLPPLGFGAMRLSTAPAKGSRPDAEQALRVLRRAFELGIRLVDTADAYALDDKDMHHNERLVRRALDGWPSPERDDVIIATKVGLIRPGGRWLPNGRPEHLKRAAELSLQALGLDALPLLQLHVRDPRVPWEESLGALADLHREGKARYLGVSNVSVHDVAGALRALPAGSLIAVQNELSAVDTSAADGVLALCRAHGLAFLAHSPLGGHRGVGRLAKVTALESVATRHGLHTKHSREEREALAREAHPPTTAPDGPPEPDAAAAFGRHQIALAYLATLDPAIIPLAGATKVETLEASVQALAVTLDDGERSALDAAFPKAAALRNQAAPELRLDLSAPIYEDLPPPGLQPEVVVVLGIPGAGKSTLIEAYLANGYVRLNRDERGGKLDGLIPALKNALADGRTQVVLDNTYPTRKSRAAVIEAAKAAGVPCHCLWLDTAIDDARQNAVLRMIGRHGHLLAPDEIAAFGKTEANTIPPMAQSAWLRSFEPPSPDEGFDRVERRPFVRSEPPGRSAKGLLLDVDGTLRTTRSGEIYPRDVGDIILLPGRREALEKWLKSGWRLFFVSNQSGIASGKLERQVAESTFQRTIDLLALPIDEVAFCPHPAYPVGCFCRKPMPGLGVWLVERHRLARRHLAMVGDMDSDRDFARALGATYFDAATFFANGGIDPPST